MYVTLLINTYMNISTCHRSNPASKVGPSLQDQSCCNGTSFYYLFSLQRPACSSQLDWCIVSDKGEELEGGIFHKFKQRNKNVQMDVKNTFDFHSMKR